MILGILDFLINLIGIYGYYNDMYKFVYIAGIFTLCVDILGLFQGQNKTIFWSIFFPIIIGLLVFEKSIVGALMGVSVMSSIFFVLGILYILFMLIFSKDKKEEKNIHNNTSANSLDSQNEGLDFECSNCGKLISSNCNECPKCGALFVDNDEEIQEETNNVNYNEDDYNFKCSNCGAYVSDDDEECPKCGAQFVEEIEEKSESEKLIDSYDDLIKLKDLLDKEIITKEEFEKMKKKVINKK